MSSRRDSVDSNGPFGFFNKNKKDLNLLGDSNFLSNFNPENSKREQAKMKRQTYKKPAKPKMSIDSIYDENGVIRSTREDECDCFEKHCPGCHFPCANCGSGKCAIKCRVNRKFHYESILRDGTDKVEVNPSVTTLSYKYST
ncbi:unnamed protein product [Diamesa hyperborea]